MRLRNCAIERLEEALHSAPHLLNALGHLSAVLRIDFDRVLDFDFSVRTRRGAFLGMGGERHGGQQQRERKETLHGVHLPIKGRAVYPSLLTQFKSLMGGTRHDRKALRCSLPGLTQWRNADARKWRRLRDSNPRWSF